MENGELLNKYIKARTLENLSEKTVKDDVDNIKKFIDFLNDRAITDETVLDYLNYIRTYTFVKNNKKQKYSKYSLYQIESKLKRFLTFLNNPSASLIHPRLPKNRKLPEDMLTENEIKKILDVCQTYRDKALVSFLYESACRKGELFSLKIKNVKFDEHGAVVTFPDGKTGSRRIRIVYSSMYLEQYIENHPKGSNHDSPLFCSNREPYPRLSDSGLKEQLKELAKRACIKKDIYPHLFRHSRCTVLAENLTEQQLKVYAGWTAGSNMASIYVHLSGRDVDKAILKMNGVNIEDTFVTGLQVGRCPRCHELNPATSKYCGKCGMPLSDETNIELTNDKTNLDRLIMKAISENPAVFKVLEDEINKLSNNKS